MIRGNLPNISFQTFYVSKEISNCPFISEIVRASKRLKELDFFETVNDMIVSLRYGKRVLITADNTDLREIKQEDFLEIVDYDPLKKVLLAMGPKKPRVDTSIHWLIHHSRDEINAAIQLNDKMLTEKLVKKIPATKKEYPAGTLEQAKEVLKGLRNSKRIVIKNQGVLFVGNSIKDVEDLVLKTCEELK